MRLVSISGSTRSARCISLVLLVGLLSGCSQETRDSADGAGTVESVAAPVPAPALTLVTMSGDSASLEGLRGAPVLLNIWATWCAPCREEMPLLQQLHLANEKAGLKVIGVSIDARGEDERIERFLAEFKVTFPIWRDPDEWASFRFKTLGVPATFLINRDGQIVWRKLGPLRQNDAVFNDALTLALRPLTGLN